ncbi:hypothetical protein [Moorella sp. ACPs]|uniref:hypothetical protein n=1 Tax=Neomoorella carbonis TaxID=3062783 RepID=UPI0032563208
MFKKWMTILLTSIVILSLLSGCGGQKSSQQTEKNQVQNQQAETQKVPDIPLPKGGHVKAVNKLPSKPLRLAFLSFQNNPFWYPVRDGALAAKDYLKNFNTTVDYIPSSAPCEQPKNNFYRVQKEIKVERIF